MQHFICVTCGTQYPASATPPDECPICTDDRQYVNPRGQQWTTLEELRPHHCNVFRDIAPGLATIATEPTVGIGQQAHLVQTPHGNVLWDCLAFIDDATVTEVERRGGLAAIAISHPHFHTTMVEWSRAFGAIPVYIHRANAPWVMRPDEVVRYWEGETRELLPGVTLIHCGGHFPGSSVLHWSGGAGGQGELFTGDTIYVVADNRWVTFMYSYPNDIPLDPQAVRQIVAAVNPWPFEVLRAAFGRPVERDARGAVQRSAERYIAHVTGAWRAAGPQP
jgi:hypothetical protein